MSRLTSALMVDGVEIEEGSVEAVVMYEKLLREANAKILDAAQLLAVVPDEVAKTWRARHSRAERALYLHVGNVGRFSRDYRVRGYESAIADANFRKELS